MKHFSNVLKEPLQTNYYVLVVVQFGSNSDLQSKVSHSPATHKHSII